VQSETRGRRGRRVRRGRSGGGMKRI